MSDSSDPQDIGQRCPRCDTRNAAGARVCIGCGTLLATAAPTATPNPAARAPRRSARSAGGDAWVEWLGNVLLILVVIGAIGLALITRRRQQADALALVITATPTASATPTIIATPALPPTITPTGSPTPTAEPTATPTPLPTATPQPPVDYRIGEGEALYNIALRYEVSVDSIIAANPGLAPDQIVAGQTLLVPLPTATPPLVRVAIELNGETAVADPTDCVIHAITTADTLFGIARQYDVPIEALLVMNRLSAERILRVGDTVCIPTVTFDPAAADADAAVLGSNRPVIDRPRLLYPVAGAAIGAERVTLQWLAERPLDATEWYMVELTDLSDATARPQRAFVRQTSLQLPADWLPADGTPATLRWRVSYVRVTGERGDGDFIYAYGGPSSEAAFSLLP